MFVLTPSRREGRGPGRMVTLQRGGPWQLVRPAVGKARWSDGQGGSEELSRMACGWPAFAGAVTER